MKPGEDMKPITTWRIVEERGNIRLQKRCWLFFWKTYQCHDDYSVVFYDPDGWGNPTSFATFEEAYECLKDVSTPRKPTIKVLAEYE